MELDKCFFNSTGAECSFSKGQMTAILPDDLTKAIISKISKTLYAVSRISREPYQFAICLLARHCDPHFVEGLAVLDTL